MKALVKTDRVKLAKLLSLFGSNHAGERDAAGLAAHRLVQQRGLTWQDVLCGHVMVQIPEEFRHRRASEIHDVQASLMFCIRHMQVLKSWEQNFISTSAHRARITPKMAAVIFGIAADLRAKGFA